MIDGMQNAEWDKPATFRCHKNSFRHRMRLHTLGNTSSARSSSVTGSISSLTRRDIWERIMAIEIVLYPGVGAIEVREITSSVHPSISKCFSFMSGRDYNSQWWGRAPSMSHVCRLGRSRYNAESVENLLLLPIFSCKPRLQTPADVKAPVGEVSSSAVSSIFAYWQWGIQSMSSSILPS